MEESKEMATSGSHSTRFNDIMASTSKHLKNETKNTLLPFIFQQTE